MIETKTVQKFGNSSHVVLPKEYVGRRIKFITKTKTFLQIKSEIIEILTPNLEHVLGVYLYGSYARNEQTLQSDIDILVITGKKFKLKSEDYEITIMTMDQIKNSIKNSPMHLTMVNEAKAIINNPLLEEIKKIKLNKGSFNFMIETTESILKVNREFIKLEDEDFKSFPTIYSLILRLRGLYTIKCITKNKKFTNKEFKEYANKKGVKNLNKLYNIYRAVRDKKRVTNKISKKEVIKLYNIVKNETEKKSKEIN